MYLASWNYCMGVVRPGTRFSGWNYAFGITCLNNSLFV